MSKKRFFRLPDTPHTTSVQDRVWSVSQLLFRIARQMTPRVGKSLISRWTIVRHAVARLKIAFLGACTPYTSVTEIDYH